MNAETIKFRSQEGGDASIQAQNLQIMSTEMLVLLSSESIGGNAGHEEVEGRRLPCAAANGYADPQTGKIVSFGNFQDIPKDILKGNQEFTLRVALDIRKGHSRIINFFGAEKFSKKGRKNIETAIERYNSRNN